MCKSERDLREKAVLGSEPAIRSFFFFFRAKAGKRGPDCRLCWASSGLENLSSLSMQDFISFV